MLQPVHYTHPLGIVSKLKLVWRMLSFSLVLSLCLQLYKMKLGLWENGRISLEAPPPPPPHTLSISLWSMCLMPLTSVLRKLFWKLSLSACGSFYSCVYLTLLHFCFYYKQSMPLSLRFDTVSHLNLVISRGTHHTALQQDPHESVEPEGHMFVHARVRNSFDGCAKFNLSGKTDSLRFWRPSAKGFVQKPACVLRAPNNQGLRGHQAC